MQNLCLKGDAIARFRFLLEADYPFETAAHLAQDPGAVSRLRHRLMYTELKARNDDVRLSVVEEMTNLYSKTYRRTAIEAMDDGHSVQHAVNLAAKKADTIAALSTEGNIARPVQNSGLGQENSGEICMAIAAVEHPLKVMKEEHFDMIRKHLLQRVCDLQDNQRPHLLDCTWVQKFGYMRLICANSKGVKWLKQTLPKLDLWPNAAICLLLESKLQQAGVYAVSLEDSADDSIEDILGYFQSQNEGFSVPKWEVLSKQLCNNQKTIKLLIKMPEDPDEDLLQAAGNELNFKFGKIKFTKPPVALVKNNMWGCAAYSALFPDDPKTSSAEVLKFLESQNEGLAVSKWSVIGDQKRFFRDGKKVLRLEFIVDAASDETIKRAKKELNFQFAKVRFQPEDLRHAHTKSVKKVQQPPAGLGKRKNGV